MFISKVHFILYKFIYCAILGCLAGKSFIRFGYSRYRITIKIKFWYLLSGSTYCVILSMRLCNNFIWYYTCPHLVLQALLRYKKRRLSNIPRKKNYNCNRHHKLQPVSVTEFLENQDFFLLMLTQLNSKNKIMII